MTAEESKALARKFVDACNAHDMDRILSCLHPDCVHHARLADYPMMGVAAAFRATWTALPDLHWEILDLVAEGDTVVTATEITGTHEGSYLGQPGTGTRISIRNVDIARVADGLFVEHRGLMDELHLLVQIGILDDRLLTQMS